MEGNDYELVCPFWIDTEGYTDRDRLMFSCGVEFHMFLNDVRDEPRAFELYVMRENESRVRMAAARFGRHVKVIPCEVWADPEKQWSHVQVEAKG